MITRLRIKNFKSLADTGDLAIRPLTLLVGPNSGGKTSILQSLLLLRQTVDSRDITVPLVVNGEYVRLGSYPDFVFMQDRTKRLRIEFEFTPRRPLSLALSPGLETRTVEGEVRVATEFSYNKKTMQIFVQTTEIEVGNVRVDIKRSNGKYKVSFDRPGGTTEYEAEATYKFYNAALSPSKGTRQAIRLLSRQLALGIRDSEKRRLSGQFASAISYSEMRSLSLQLASAIETLFGNLYYLGPLRERPQRSYVASGVAPQDVGLKGELFVDVLWAQTKRKTTVEPLMSKVNLWMARFGLASELKLRRIGKTNNYSLDLVDPQTQLSINIADVGFGASQILPIIVEGFYAPPKAVLLIEQPEIHLHPGAQAMLGDLFVDLAIEQGKTLLVETHSEHLLARIQRRIAEGKLKAFDVGIYYCQPTCDGTRIVEIKLNELGQFEQEGLPEGFFEEGYLESLEHLRAMAHVAAKG